MKINYFKSTAILLLIIPLFSLSCVSEKSKKENELVGTWHSQAKGGEFYKYWFQFKDDNTLLIGKEALVKVNCMWKIDVESNAILWYYDSGKIMAKVHYNINGKTLTLYDLDDGDNVKLVKSKK